MPPIEMKLVNDAPGCFQPNSCSLKALPVQRDRDLQTQNMVILNRLILIFVLKKEDLLQPMPMNRVE